MFRKFCFRRPCRRKLTDTNGCALSFFPAPSHFVFVSGNLLQIILNAVANGLDLLHAQSMKDLYRLTQFFPPAPDPWSNISIRVRNIVVRVRFFLL